MTRSSLITSLCLLLLCIASACSKPAENSASTTASTPAASPALTEDKHVRSVDVVKVTPQPLEIAAGGSGEAVVLLTVQNGYHINANPPTYPYLIATALEVPPANGLSAGKVTYPKPLSRKFIFAAKPLAVYEGDNELRAIIKAEKSATPAQQPLAAKLRIQACDEAVCYPPGTLDLVIPVSIK
ncbi:MAG TPA: protein-disulfide reductase DsbD domain-containing protein [Pyrinomonadaceae bacterium]|nr:protein-disulfide reductase DsbD domain-containing protein [Pyrinomonadaceae bacterium]